MPIASEFSDKPAIVSCLCFSYAEACTHKTPFTICMPRQEPSLEFYINDVDNLARHLQLPKQQKIHYFIFGLKLKQELIQ